MEERRSRVVLGLDPDPAALWPQALQGEGGWEPAEAAAAAVARHCRAAIEAAGAACVAVKLQLACFERLGAPGWNALGAAASAAREHGLLVIADGKRGDVPVTATAYAQALLGETPSPFGPIAGLGADAITVNPLLGEDSLEPFAEAAAAAGAGCFVLARTSNPGAAELQDEGDPPLHERLAELVDRLGAERVGESGLSCIGAVAGATQPGLLARLRELMPRADPAAAGCRGSGRAGGGPRPGLLASPGRRAGDRVALDRECPRTARRRSRERSRGRGGGAPLRRLGAMSRTRPYAAPSRPQPCPNEEDADLPD